MKPVEPSLQLARLSEGSDPALTEAIADLRRQGPDAAELASLASRLALQGIAVTGATAATSTSAAHGAWKKWLLAGGGAASGVALWLSFGKPSPTPPTAPPPPAAPAVVATASAARPSSPLRNSSAEGATGAGTNATASASATPTVTSVGSAAPLEPGVTPRASSSGAEPVARDAGASQRLDSTARAARTSTSAAPPGPSSLGGGTLEGPAPASTEIELLRDARLALKQSPGAALELVERHARTFPSGKLAQERELIAISALVALGRRTAASSRAARFERAFPDSPYRKQIAELLR